MLMTSLARDALALGSTKVEVEVEAGLSHPFLGMGPEPIELGKLAEFSLKLGN